MSMHQRSFLTCVLCVGAAQTTTCAKLAYSAVVLTIIGYPLLDKIEALRLAPPPKPKSGGVTAELEAAAAAGAAAAAAALKAGRALSLSLVFFYSQPPITSRLALQQFTLSTMYSLGSSGNASGTDLSP